MLGDLRTLHLADAKSDTWRPVGDDVEQDYRRCANFESPAGCNWLVAVDDPEELCLACRLNRTIPDLDDPDNRRYWRDIEAEKRRLVSQLLALDLPVKSKAEDPDGVLAFDLLRSPAEGTRVLTGHANGLITLEDLYDPKHPDAVRTLFLLNSWVEMITVLNEMARSLGQPDFYPFVMPKAVVKKLHFINLVITDSRRTIEDRRCLEDPETTACASG